MAMIAAATMNALLVADFICVSSLAMYGVFSMKSVATKLVDQQATQAATSPTVL
jgi:hypothetical protein